MRFQLISDLHGNFDRVKWDKEADIVLCAGDVSENIQKGMSFLNTSPNPVIFIPGNHEFYKGNFNDRMNEMQESCDKSDVVTFANNQIININDTRIVCTSLWSNFVGSPILNFGAELQMNDYNHIDVSGFFDNNAHSEERYYQIIEQFSLTARSILRGTDAYAKKRLIDLLHKNHGKFNLPYQNIHEILENLPWKERGNNFNSFYSTLLYEESIEFLHRALRTPHEGKTVIMTHHAPSYTALSMSRHAVDPRCVNMEPVLKRILNLNKIGAYANRLEKFSVQYPIDAWVHGHLHERMLYRLGSAAVYCNATGRNTNTEERRGFDSFSFYLDEEHKRKALFNLLRHTIYITRKVNAFIQHVNTNKNTVAPLEEEDLKALCKEVHILLQTLITVPEINIAEKAGYYKSYPELKNEFNYLKLISIEVVKQNIQLIQDLQEILESVEKEL